MKILFSLTYYTPYTSGLTLYVKCLAEALVKRKFQISVLTMNFDKKDHVVQFVNGVRVVRVDYLAKISKGFVSFDWIVKSFQEVRKADTVIISLPQFEGIVPAIWSKLLGKKIISIYLSEVKLPFTLTNYIAEKVLDLANLSTLLLSNKIVTYNDDFASHSQILPYFQKKTVYINPPIIIPNINKRAKKVLIEKMGVSVKYRIGIIARIAAEKGIEYLVEAIPFIKSLIPDSNIKIYLVGPTSPVGELEYQKKIKRLINEYKQDVLLLGELKDDEIGAFYSLLDVLVLPSINSTEAFGMVQVEAMMMGVPVVTTDLPGVRVPIQKTGMGLLVPVRNSQKLAEAIIEILSNRKKYIKPRELIEKEFSFQKTIKFYEELL